MLLREAITRVLEEPYDVVLARSILGTTEVEAIAVRIEDHVARTLGRAVTACRQFSQSIGAVFVLELDDGRAIALKAHAFGTDRWRGFGTRSELQAVYEVQAELAALGLPCAKVLAAPSSFGDGVAAIMSAIPEAPQDAPHEPAVRRAMAQMLAHTVELGRTIRADGLRHETLPSSTLPRPHNALFDFDRPGGEWIDARARSARAALDRAPSPVVMHSDFSCANVRVTAGKVTAIFDMDSVCLIDEVRCLASAAVHFTYVGDGPWAWPTRDQARAFVADYEAVRGRPFTIDERARLDAGAIYSIAYTAKCEHGGDGSRRAACEALAAAPDAYF